MDGGYRKLISEAGGLALGLEDAIDETSPRAINDLLAEELPQLQSLTEQLEATACPAEATEVHKRLLAGLRTFADDLMAVQEEGTLAASQGDVYQSGLFFSSMNVVEGGARMRWELANSHGLAQIRQALGELKEAGWTENGLG